MPTPYNEPNDQPAFTSAFSFDEAEAVPSFSRFRRKLNLLFSASDPAKGSSESAGNQQDGG
jgi:hypothetical protein